MKKGSAIKRWLLFLVIFATAFGIFCGVIWGSSLENQEYSVLREKIESYNSVRHEGSLHEGSLIESFNEALFKYGKLAVFIWFMGFISIGFVGNLCILFSKGLAVGFTTTVLLRMFNAGQAADYILSYTLQSLILLPVYALSAYKSIDFILKYLKQDKEKHNLIIQSYIASYTVSYMVCCLPLILACIVEASF